MLAPGTTLSVEDGQHGRGRRQSSPALRAKPPRPATSPAVCRGWPSCSRRACPRTTRSSPRSRGRVEFVSDYKAKRKIAIIPEEGDPVEYLVPKSKVIDVQEGDFVKRATT